MFVFGSCVDEITVIQRHASALWKFSSRYLDNMRAGEMNDTNIQSVVSRTREMIMVAGDGRLFAKLGGC